MNKLDFAIGVEDEGIHIEEDLDEDSIWHQVEFTERKNSNVQTFTRGLTPDQIRINRGSMPEWNWVQVLLMMDGTLLR